MATRTSVTDKEDLLIKTNNGLDIYHEELDLKRKGNNLITCCPFHSERSPSFTIFPEGNYYCFGCEEKGNIFSFLMKRYNLSYKEALLKVKNNTQLNPINTQNTVKKLKREPLVVEFSEMKFTKEHHEYFNQYELTEDYLTKERDTYAISKYAVNGRLVKIPKDVIVFGSFAPDLEEIKFMFHGKGITKQEKWKSYNIPNKYIWYYHNYENTCCNELFVCKSNKDANVLSLLGYCTVSTQSEGSKILLQNNVEKLNAIGKNIYVVFGSDSQGRTASQEITKETGWKWLNTQNYLLSMGINDPAEYVKELSLEALDKEIKKQLKKKKGYI